MENKYDFKINHLFYESEDDTIEYEAGGSGL